MSYTVKKMAKLSGVSVRTLHWYDKIGLLKPAFIGQNGYRYYEDEQLFDLLYDILFYKDLGLSLSEIKNLMPKPNDCKISAMKQRKQSLMKDIQLKTSLLVSVDKTLHHFETMSLLDCKYPHDFDTTRQREYEFFLITHKNYSVNELRKIQQTRIQRISKSEFNQIKISSQRIYHSLKNLLQNKIEPNDSKALNIIEQHFLLLEKFYDIDLKFYFKLQSFYQKRENLTDMHNFYHKRLSNYIALAIDNFQKTNKNLVV